MDRRMDDSHTTMIGGNNFLKLFLLLLLLLCHTAILANVLTGHLSAAAIRPSASVRVLVVCLPVSRSILGYGLAPKRRQFCCFFVVVAGTYLIYMFVGLY